MSSTPPSKSTLTKTDAMPPDHLGILIAAALMVLVGWWGLYGLVTQTIPRVGQRWLFFVLLNMAITGTFIPLVRYLNVRFTPVHAELPAGGVIVRQAMWIGVYSVSCAWLQIPRVLTVSIAFFLALVFIVTEFFLRLRELQNEAQDGA